MSKPTPRPPAPKTVPFGDGKVSRPKPDWSERTHPKTEHDK